MGKRITIKDVAKHAGVSISTVSNFINGNYRNMSAETRERVGQAVETLGYFPSLGAQALPRKRKTQTVCIVIPHDVDYTFHHSYFAEVMRGIAQVLDQGEYQAMILTTKDRSLKEVAYLQGLTQGIVDGIIFFDVEQHDPFVREFGSSATPVMFVGCSDSSITRYVDNNVEDGATQAIGHLLDRGHRTIRLLAGPEPMIFSRQLVAGMRRAYSTLGIDLDEGQVSYGEFTEASGYEAAALLLQAEPSVTAVFTASGKQAVGVMEYARQCDVQIPGRLSLVSFGKHPVVGALGRRLTYLDQPEVEVGMRVARKLLDQINDPSTIIRPEVLPLSLVVGETTAQV
jgi:DNA-binding LacI/PurR family transcriptional regulator